MIFLTLLCGRPEILQGDYSFEVLQGCALLCPGVTHACTRTQGRIKGGQRE